MDFDHDYMQGFAPKMHCINLGVLNEHELPISRTNKPCFFSIVSNYISDSIVKQPQIGGCVCTLLIRDNKHNFTFFSFLEFFKAAFSKE